MSTPLTTPIPTKAQGTYRVIHTADWHLGKLLGEASRQEEHDRFFQFLLESIEAHEVDALVIAGDVFDSANPPQRAVSQYYTFLSQLLRIGNCRVILTAGNHDSPGHLDAPKEILRALGAYVVGAMPESTGDVLILLPDARAPQLVVAALPFLRDRDLRTGMSGQSSTDIQQALVDGIRAQYAAVATSAQSYMDQGIPVMATGHLTVLGSKVSDSERDIHVGGLGTVGTDIFPDGFAYVALGHLHRPQQAGKREEIRYSGSPIPLSFSEAEDRKSLCLLDFAEGRLLQQTRLAIPLARQLKQITTTRGNIEQSLADFNPEPSEFPAWVELIIEDPIVGDNLPERARELAQDRPFEIIRLISRPSSPTHDPQTGTPTEATDIDRLLDNPEEVFERRLNEEVNLTDTEKEALRTAFRELRSLSTEEEANR
jgi:exonuclease SbcD